MSIEQQPSNLTETSHHLYMISIRREKKTVQMQLEQSLAKIEYMEKIE